MSPFTVNVIIDWVRDARRQLCELVADLDDAELMGPRLPTVNPLLWEIGHVAWFQEKWVLRRAGTYDSIRPDADSLYDSASIAHDIWAGFRTCALEPGARQP